MFWNEVRYIQLKYYVYILEFTDGSFYTGVTGNLSERIKRHSSRRGSKYARGHGSFSLVYTKEYETLAEARKIELKIKNYSNNKKKLLIQSNPGK